MPGRLPTVSIGIAAYNAEANIGAILRAASSQCEDHVVILEIIIHSDHSTDGTIASARECPDPRIKIVDRPVRGGFAASVGSMLEMFTGDALVLLNDDIRITDDRFIEKATMPIFRRNADLVGANLQPLPARTFVEKASVSVFRVWERIRASLPNRNNIFTFDGAAMCLSANFARSVDLAASLGRTGNVDAFLYFSCIRAGLRYGYAHEAVAYYRSPATLRDYVARNTRNDSQRRLLKKQFGAVVDQSFRVPSALYWKSVFAEILKDPLVSAFVFVLRFYIRSKAQDAARHASSTWEVLKSSKELD